MNNSFRPPLPLLRFAFKFKALALSTCILSALALLNIVASAQERLPVSIDKALQEAEAVSDLKLNFTITFRWPGIEDIVQRYDATRNEWTPVSGNPEDLNATGRRKLQAYKRLESAPGGLVYADYREHIMDVTLLDDSKDQKQGIHHYSFVSPRTPDFVKGSEELVKSRLSLDTNSGGLTKYSIEAMQPFRPNPMSRLEEFTFDQTFERIFADTPPLMTSLYWRAKGKRFFSTVDEEFTILFSDFEHAN